MTVNFHHDLGVIPRQIRYLQLPVDSDVLKKNINTSQIARLQRRAETRAKSGAGKAITDTEKATLKAGEAKYAAEEAKHSAEETKAILLKTEKHSEEAIDK